MVSLSEQMEICEQLEMKVYFAPGSSLITIAAIVRVAWVDMEAKQDGYYRFGVSFVKISPVDREKLGGFHDLQADPTKAPPELKSPTAGRLNPSRPSVPDRQKRNPRHTLWHSAPSRNFSVSQGGRWVQEKADRPMKSEAKAASRGFPDKILLPFSILNGGTKTLDALYQAPNF